MVDRAVSCVVDGDTFLGSFAIVAIQADEAVSVRYKRARRSAKIGDQKPETVARTLLGALVREDLRRGTLPVRPRLLPAKTTLQMRRMSPTSPGGDAPGPRCRTSVGSGMPKPKPSPPPKAP